MLYEIRTYRLKPRGVPEFMEKFGEAYESVRKDFSPLAAFFYSEIGPLNEVTHIWPYKDLAERAEIRAAAAATGAWPPKASEVIDHMQSEIFHPFPFVGEFPTGEMGPVFEYRYYTVHPGTLPGIMKGWEEAIEERTKYSPLVTAMYTDLGELNKYVHIWSYESLEHRREVRAEVAAKKIWPPKGSPKGALVRQDNKILLAAPFSPLR